MGYRELELKLPTSYSDPMVHQQIGRLLQLKDFSWQILHKSLDARHKGNIHWLVRVGVVSGELKGGNQPVEAPLHIPFKKRKEKVLVLGSGPAGFFAAFILQMAGFKTTIIERGCEVGKREQGILRFESEGIFDQQSNYAFGEGGAGTFSDGKLTSRSKQISREKRFILESYIKAGAPGEILYLTHPHLGSDNLKVIVANLRREFTALGGTILFETLLEDLKVVDGRVIHAITSAGEVEASRFILAPGHSAYETYHMLMRRGVAFRTKNFALGFRAEHRQETINLGQWGVAELPGVKAAEYRLTSNHQGQLPVFTFCMCPGGEVVPATPYSTTNIVNGMSYYQRNGEFANAACVAGLHPDLMGKGTLNASETLNRLRELEESFFRFSEGYRAPFCSIREFLDRKNRSDDHETSYKPGLIPAPLWEMVPRQVAEAISLGMKDFNQKLKGYENGILLGLESKTSSPVQVIRDERGKCEGFSNLYMAGEGSGYAGGIISSAADGIRVALSIAGQE